MAKAVQPRTRRVAAGFALYALIAISAAYWFSPQIAPYVDPGATFWISTAYVILGAVALAGLCAGALVRARHLEDRLDELEALQRRVLEIEDLSVSPGSDPGRESVTDSGSAELEVEELLDGLTEITNVAERAPNLRAAVDPESSPVGELPRGDTGEVTRLRRARDAVGLSAAGPALVAIALIGFFAPMLPASDGLLLSNLQIAAFFGVAGLAVLIALPVYAAAAFRQVRIRVD